MNLATMTIADFLDHPVVCNCGHCHTSDVKTVEIGPGALSKLPSIVKHLGYDKAFVLADCHTYRAAGQQVLTNLESRDIPYTSFILDADEVVPDEYTIGSVLMHLDPSCNLIIGVGTGTINDISRFISHRMRLPYFIVATAPSMDGFASTVAPLITNNLKTTYDAHVPQAIIADLDILADAPMPMIAAGFADIVGKYTCLCDWKLSAIINDEYYCETIASIMRLALKRTIASKNGLLNRDKAAIGRLTEALVLAGIAMSYAGNSRPASGSEHHLSHFWEMRFLFENKKAVLHGAKVGIGTVIILRLYEYLAKTHFDFAKIKASPTPKPNDAWKAEIARVFGPAAEGVILLEERVGKNLPAKREQRLASVEKHWAEIHSLISALPPSDEVAKLLADIEGPMHPKQVGLDQAAVKDSLLFAKEVRNRYTILQLLWDLQLLEPYTNQIVNELYQ